jgi:hypothetical protein
MACCAIATTPATARFCFASGTTRCCATIADNWFPCCRSCSTCTAREKAEQERAALLVRERDARQHAEEADRLKDEFLATLSHEAAHAADVDSRLGVDDSQRRS